MYEAGPQERFKQEKSIGESLASISQREHTKTKNANGSSKKERMPMTRGQVREGMPYK